MSEVDLTQQLDQAIDAMIAAGGIIPGQIDERVAELLGIAVELRDLPRHDFKERLRRELDEEVSMSTATKKASEKVSGVRKGFRTVTPYLVVSDVHAEAEFLKQTFGVTGQIHGLGSQGGFHAEYNIGGSMIMVGGGGEGSQWKGTPLPTYLHLYVEDVDAIYEKAVEAGATNLSAPGERFYGDRECGFRDPGGNEWFVATHQGESFIPEGLPNLMPTLLPIGAPKMIEFLKQAFGAEELAVHKSPDGAVKHATIQVGSSVIELGEAHGQWQPMSSMFMVYVDDSDDAYAQAMKAEGAISISVPANAPYGGRTGAIKDPWGNSWYLSSHAQKEE